MPLSPSRARSLAGVLPVLPVVLVLALVGCAPAPRYSAWLASSNGERLPTMRRGQETVTIGAPGEAYEIVLENATKESVGLAVSVDGLDVASGQRMSFAPADIQKRGGCAVGASTVAKMTGFPVSASQLSSFRFVHAPAAYASLLGAPEQLGTIEIGIYRLRKRTPFTGPGAYVVPPPLGATGRGPDDLAPPLFGELVPDDRSLVDDLEQDPDHELGHIVLLYAGRDGPLGTASPPPDTAPPPRRPSPPPHDVEQAPPPSGPLPIKPPPVVPPDKAKPRDRKTPPAAAQ